MTTSVSTVRSRFHLTRKQFLGDRRRYPRRGLVCLGLLVWGLLLFWWLAFMSIRVPDPVFLLGEWWHTLGLSQMTGWQIDPAQVRPMAPWSLQLLALWLPGIFLGPRWGGVFAIGCLALGLLGLPIFGQGGGLTYLAKPTFGYLVGAALLSFWLGEKAHKWFCWPRAVRWPRLTTRALLLSLITCFLAHGAGVVWVLGWLLLGHTAGVWTFSADVFLPLWHQWTLAPFLYDVLGLFLLLLLTRPARGVLWLLVY